MAASRRVFSFSRSTARGSSSNSGTAAWQGLPMFQLRNPSAAMRSNFRFTGERTLPPNTT